jgi:hypothetical protein
MKKIYLLTVLILFCCVQITHAQPYQSIFGDSTQFNVFVPLMYLKSPIDYDPELGEGDTESIFFKHGNDTIINGQSYQLGYAYLFGVNFAFVREDSLHGKIYSYAPQCDEEYLVCDLSLNVGDTFYLQRCQHSIVINDGYMIVDSVTYLDGKKTIYLGNSFNGIPFEIRFIEGIGATFGPLSHKYEYSHGALGLNILLCVHKNENRVYIRNPEASYGCYYQYGWNINELPKNRLNLYPNPVTDQLTVKNGELTITHLQVIDVLGRIIMNITTQNKSEITINTSVLNPGLYFIKATINGNSVIEKIIKQ